VLAAFIIRAIALMMEAASNCETSVNFYRTIRRNKPEDSHLRTHHRENLKSHMIQFVRNRQRYYIYTKYNDGLYRRDSVASKTSFLVTGCTSVTVKAGILSHIVTEVHYLSVVYVIYIQEVSNACMSQMRSMHCGN
jgi:hypothetical protein